MSDNKFERAAQNILNAYRTGEYADPVRELIGEELEAGYQVQSILTDHWIGEGRRLCGRKIGLTAEAVQKQLGVSQPDFGMLFTDMEYADGAEIPFSKMQQPKAEAELALILKEDIGHADVTYSELVRAVDYVVPAIEIVGSRIRDWNIRIADTVADNASSGLYVLGSPVRSLDGLDLATAGMILKRNGRPVSYGAGMACLGHPLNAALWLARTCAGLGRGLKAGDVVLTGALGPMVPIAAGDAFEASIAGIGSVSFTVGLD